jgi:hypothetical protein
MVEGQRFDTKYLDLYYHLSTLAFESIDSIRRYIRATSVELKEDRPDYSCSLYHISQIGNLSRIVNVRVSHKAPGISKTGFACRRP